MSPRAFSMPKVSFLALRYQIEADGCSAVRWYVRDAHWDTDASLHNLFIDACGNPVMSSMIKSLRATTHLFEVARLQDRLIPDNNEHIAILDALEAEDARAARRAVQTHIRSLHRFALTTVS